MKHKVVAVLVARVLLPNSIEYEGRFTGLTPYQAGNKALSKYYRETNKPKKEIQFSIRESTREANVQYTHIMDAAKNSRLQLNTQLKMAVLL